MRRRIGSQGSAVLQIVSSLEVGGAERLLIDFIKSCDGKAPYPQVVVVINDRRDSDMVNELSSAPVPVYYLGRPEGSKNPRYIFDLIRIICRHRVAIMHSHGRGSKYFAALCRIIKPRLKLVHTFHDTHLGINSTDALIHNAMIGLSIAISKAVAEEVSSSGIIRVEQIENGIPIASFLPIYPQPLGSKARIISVGRLLPEKKGQDVLIRAVKRCVDRGLDVECTFAGSATTGDAHTVPMLEELIESLGLLGRVHIVQGRTDVATLLAEANLFVLPSRWEGFGLALVEAMAAGLPVIASDIDGPSEIISDGVDGLLFAAGSDEQLASRIALIIQSPALADKLRENGRIKSSEYDISKMRDKYMDVYKRLTSTT